MLPYLKLNVNIFLILNLDVRRLKIKENEKGLEPYPPLILTSHQVKCDTIPLVYGDFLHFVPTLEKGHPFVNLLWFSLVMDNVLVIDF